MILNDEVCYRALSARDNRFDGLFFVGVKSTGIYCRPICTAKTPGRGRCRFFGSAALAEQSGFRPCLRCRPELAPGHAPVDQVHSVAQAAAAQIEAGVLQQGSSLEDLAASFGLSSRQLRRSVRKELGVSPIELAQTNRLLLAKRLIAETNLPMTQVAFAAGFESVRRFNSLFQSHYRLTPSEMRRSKKDLHPLDSVRLQVAYRPPFDGKALVRFLAARAIPGVEHVHDNVYYRTVRIGKDRGWIGVSLVANQNVVQIEIATALAPVLPALLARVRHVFDLDARPDVIDAHLANDKQFAPLIQQRPGLRVPGAFEPFELCMRAILGQQISVRAASTLAGRFAQRFGEAIKTPFPSLNRLAPTAETFGEVRSSALEELGLLKVRAESLRSFARSIARGDIKVDGLSDPLATIAQLVELPGIGPWTAEYIAMRALRWPDAFPTGDLGLRKAARSLFNEPLSRLGERWRPWRSYAAMHLWESLCTRLKNVSSLAPNSCHSAKGRKPAVR